MLKHKTAFYNDLQYWLEVSASVDHTTCVNAVLAVVYKMACHT